MECRGLKASTGAPSFSAKHLGGEALGCGLWELPPGKEVVSFPRAPRHRRACTCVFGHRGRCAPLKGSRPSAPGGVRPPGTGAHQVINDGAEPLVYLSLSAEGADVVEDPTPGRPTRRWALGRPKCFIFKLADARSDGEPGCRVSPRSPTRAAARGGAVAASAPLRYPCVSGVPCVRTSEVAPHSRDEALAALPIAVARARQQDEAGGWRRRNEAVARLLGSSDAQPLASLAGSRPRRTLTRWLDRCASTGAPVDERLGGGRVIVGGSEGHDLERWKSPLKTRCAPGCGTSNRIAENSPDIIARSDPRDLPPRLRQPAIS